MGLLNILQAAAPAVEGVIQGVVGANVAKQNTDKTIQANKDLAQYQYSKDLEMWNRGNQYNTPQAQMERINKAGLNPNLVYGQGVTGNTASQLPKYNAPTVDYKYQSPLQNIPPVLSTFQNLQQQKAQTDLLKAQINATNIKASNDIIMGTVLNSKAIAGPLQNEILRTQAGYLREISPYNLQIKQAEAQNSQESWLLRNQGQRSRNQLMGQEIQNYPLRRTQLEQQIEFNKYRNQWQRQGVTSSDHPVYRYLQRHFGDQFGKWMDENFK